ncbi:MAG: hypothetical protein JWM09_1374 [Francisellaceae bacterium]|nr:hypothetical protein [Francisellaceae bacterium]
MNKTLWVDADACPILVKEIVFRASKRLSFNVILVSNQYMVIPRTPFIKFIQVSNVFNAADTYIIENSKINDIVITADIPMAAELIDKKVRVINPRGEIYTLDKIKTILSIRNFMQDMREAGIAKGGQAPYSKSDLQNFAASLEAELAKNL